MANKAVYCGACGWRARLPMGMRDIRESFVFFPQFCSEPTVVFYFVVVVACFFVFDLKG